MNDTFSNRLQKAMDIRNMKQVEICEKTGISSSLINKYLKGKALARQDKIYILSKVLDINEAWLMGYDVDLKRIPDEDRRQNVKIDKLGNPVIEIPLLGIVKAGYDYLAQENWIGTVDIDKKLAESGEFFALKIHGDSMFPVLIEDDIVIIKKQDDFESGDIVVALINGDEATVKKGKKSESSILLQPLNTSHEPLIFTYDEMKTIPVKIIGIVKQLKREF